MVVVGIVVLVIRMVVVVVGIVVLVIRMVVVVVGCGCCGDSCTSDKDGGGRGFWWLWGLLY